MSYTKNKFGIVYEPPNCVKLERCPLTASQAFLNTSGKFMTKVTGTDNFTLTVAADTIIEGWADVGQFTSSATAAADKITLIADTNAVFEMPPDVAFTAAQLKTVIGETCDIYVTGGIQYCDWSLSSTDVLYIVGGDVEEQRLYVRINPAKMFATGVV
jgi:hypothetical protein